MNFQGHLKTSIAGGVTVSIVAYQFEPKTAFIVGLAAFLGGLFPDLDIHSTPSKWAARFGVLLSLYAILKDKTDLAVYYGLLFMLAKSDKHRGWTHSILLPPIISFLGYKFGYFNLSLAFSFGIYVHILSDSKAFKNIGK